MATDDLLNEKLLRPDSSRPLSVQHRLEEDKGPASKEPQHTLISLPYPHDCTSDIEIHTQQQELCNFKDASSNRLHHV